MGLRCERSSRGKKRTGQQQGRESLQPDANIHPGLFSPFFTHRDNPSGTPFVPSSCLPVAKPARPKRTHQPGLREIAAESKSRQRRGDDLGVMPGNRTLRRIDRDSSGLRSGTPPAQSLTVIPRSVPLWGGQPYMTRRSRWCRLRRASRRSESKFFGSDAHDAPLRRPAIRDRRRAEP
jgi:hypothetical protein